MYSIVERKHFLGLCVCWNDDGEAESLCDRGPGTGKKVAEHLIVPSCLFFLFRFSTL